MRRLVPPRQPHHLVSPELRSQVGALHVVQGRIRESALPAPDDVPGGQGRAQGAAGVARGGLDPDVLEGAFAQQLAVGHAVQGHAAGHHQVIGAGELLGGFRQAQDDLLGDLLDGQGQVHMPLVQQTLSRGRGGTPKSEVHLSSTAHRQPGGIVEIIHVEQERAVCPQVHQLLQDQLPPALDPVGLGIAVRGQAHELVFAAVDLEAACSR